MLRTPNISLMMAYLAALLMAKPQESPMESQKATLGTPTVTRTAMATTKRLIMRDDHARILFLEKRLVKNPANQTIKM